MKIPLLRNVAVLGSLLALLARAADPAPATHRYPLPWIDLSKETARHVMVAQGTDIIYQGHPTTVLLPDGKTIYGVWTYDHGGSLGPMKRSDDGGLTWSKLLEVPESWRSVNNCPTIFRLPDPAGKYRLVVYAGSGPADISQNKGNDPHMYLAHSPDDGRTWTEMSRTELAGGAMPFCTIVPINDGKALLGMTNIRRPGEKVEVKSNVVVQTVSVDGGLSWEPYRIVADLPGLKPCEPWLLRSPDGKTLLCLIRENVKRMALMMTSTDEGRTWSEPKVLPSSLWGDRHVAKYTKDGRLVVCFRDVGPGSPTRSHFMAWVGTYEDIIAGRDGQYRLKLLHSYKGGDCGYPAVEILPDDTIVATTYVKYRPGPERNSVVSVRFRLDETDQLVRQAAGAQ
jgi:hypothetical protein